MDKLHGAVIDLGLGEPARVGPLIPGGLHCDVALPGRDGDDVDDCGELVAAVGAGQETRQSQGDACAGDEAQRPSGGDVEQRQVRKHGYLLGHGLTPSRVTDAQLDDDRLSPGQFVVVEHNQARIDVRLSEIHLCCPVDVLNRTPVPARVRRNEDDGVLEFTGWGPEVGKGNGVVGDERLGAHDHREIVQGGGVWAPADGEAEGHDGQSLCPPRAHHTGLQAGSVASAQAAPLLLVEDRARRKIGVREGSHFRRGWAGWTRSDGAVTRRRGHTKDDGIVVEGAEGVTLHRVVQGESQGENVAVNQDSSPLVDARGLRHHGDSVPDVVVEKRAGAGSGHEGPIRTRIRRVAAGNITVVQPEVADGTIEPVPGIGQRIPLRPKAQLAPKAVGGGEDCTVAQGVHRAHCEGGTQRKRQGVPAPVGQHRPAAQVDRGNVSPGPEVHESDSSHQFHQQGGVSGRRGNEDSIPLHQHVHGQLEWRADAHVCREWYLQGGGVTVERLAHVIGRRAAADLDTVGRCESQAHIVHSCVTDAADEAACEWQQGERRS